MKKVRIIGYKIVFSTLQDDDELLEEFDNLLRKIDEQQVMPLIIEMQEEEIAETFNKAYNEN